MVNDPGGEPLACAARALDMPAAVFQRVLLFLKPEFGTSVNQVAGVENVLVTAGTGVPTSGAILSAAA